MLGAIVIATGVMWATALVYYRDGRHEETRPMPATPNAPDRHAVALENLREAEAELAVAEEEVREDTAAYKLACKASEERPVLDDEKIEFLKKQYVADGKLARSWDKRVVLLRKRDEARAALKGRGSK